MTVAVLLILNALWPFIVLGIVLRERRTQEQAVRERSESLERLVQLAFASRYASSAAEVVAAAQDLEREESDAPALPKKAEPVGVKVDGDELHFLSPVGRSLFDGIPESRLVRKEAP